MMETFSLDNYSDKDLRIIRQQFQKKLKGFSKELPVLSTDCQISVLVPVYDEDKKTIKRQIQAFEQQNSPKQNWELVFVVNNSKPDSPELKKVQANNQKTIAWLKKIKSRVSITVIDRSSRGREIRLDNVGKARNFGLHLIAKRYLEQNRDGLIIQTDADTYPVDKKYLEKVFKTFQKEKIFAASGGLKMVLWPETHNKKERLFYQKNLQAFRDYCEWATLLRARHLTNPKPPVTPTRFSGAHMISLALASVAAGGVPETNYAEDENFGKRLTQFSQKHKTKIFPGRDLWFLQTAIRESGRAGASFAPIFKKILKAKGQLLVNNPEAPLFSRFVKKLLPSLQKIKINTKSVITMTQQGIVPTPKELKEIFELKIKLTGHHHLSEMYEIYRKHCQVKNNNILPSFFLKLLEAKYPPVPLTKARLKQLRNQVYQDPVRKAYVQNSIKYFADFRLPKITEK